MTRRQILAARLSCLHAAVLFSVVGSALALSRPGCGDRSTASAVSLTRPAVAPPPLSFPRSRSMAATANDGFVYLMGGYASDRGYVDTVEAYDSFRNRWITGLKPMPTPRGLAAAATGPDGRIYVFGGTDGAGRNEVEAYDPSRDTWKRCRPMADRLWSLAAATGPDGLIYVAGGGRENEPFLDGLNAYDPRSDRWIHGLPAMPTPRSEFAMVAGADGLIYAIGGAGPEGPSRAVEAYDPMARRWVRCPPMPHSRARMAAAAGPDGRIYVFGGLTATSVTPNFPNAVFIYDPRSRDWFSANGLQPEREFLAGAATPDGRLLAMGGDTVATQHDAVDALAPVSRPETDRVPCGSSSGIDPPENPLTGDGAATGGRSGSPMPRVTGDWTPAPTASRMPAELYALVVGISKYEAPEIRLKFAASDAEAIGQAIASGAGRLYGPRRVHVTALTTDRMGDARPVKRRIEIAFDEIARRSRPQDKLVVYFAGHGIRLAGSRSSYAFAAQEATSLETVSAAADAATRITGEEIRSWLARIPAASRLLILDTCAASAALPALVEPLATPDENALPSGESDRRDLYLLMSSARDQESYEASRFGHGLLAEALLRGLRGDAAGPSGTLDALGLLRYAVAAVPGLASGAARAQNPRLLVSAASTLELGRAGPDGLAASPRGSSAPLVPPTVGAYRGVKGMTSRVHAAALSGG